MKKKVDFIFWLKLMVIVFIYLGVCDFIEHHWQVSRPIAKGSATFMAVLLGFWIIGRDPQRPVLAKWLLFTLLLSLAAFAIELVLTHIFGA